MFKSKYQGFHTSDEFSLASSLGTVIRTDKATYTNFIKTQIHNIRDACVWIYYLFHLNFYLLVILVCSPCEKYETNPERIVRCTR